MKKIILASGSKQRRLLFETLGLEFEIIPADIDEKAVAFDDLKSRAENIARAKAEEVAKNNPEAIIIAADTYVVKDGKALEKPRDLDEAEAMIKDLSGDQSVAYSGYCYIDKEANIDESGVAETVTKFRRLSPEFIQHYVNNNPVKDWSASFSPAYHEGMALVDSIEGSFTSFTHGLPLEIIVPLLQKSGVKI
ncbi:MAG: Maf family protein [Candidatus Pacebacteria bacterium]|nr:Maf family protein [Candidatus Paceibacterota bacterium]